MTVVTDCPVAEDADPGAFDGADGDAVTAASSLLVPVAAVGPLTFPVTRYQPAMVG